MAHFGWGYTAGSGNWAGVTVVDRAWLTTIDQNQQKAINGDEGGTWAPSSIITIGGDGLSVTGEFSAANIVEAAFEGQVDFNTGTTTFWDNVNFESTADVVFGNGSTIAGANGSAWAFGATASVVFGGPIQLVEYPTFPTPKTVYKRGLQLVGTTQTNGSSTATSDPAALVLSRYYVPGPTSFPVVHAQPTDTVQSRFWLAIPGIIDGATLTEVKVWTSGQGLTPDISFPSYQVRRHSYAAPGGWPPATLADCSVAVLDAHQVAASWGDDMRVTTIACTTNNTVDSDDYTYLLECLTQSSTSAGTVLHVHCVQAKYTVSDLRP